MRDAGSPYLNRPIRPLQDFLEGQQRLAEQRKYQEAIKVLEDLYWAVEERVSGETLWKMRQQMNAARDIIIREKGL